MKIKLINIPILRSLRVILWFQQKFIYIFVSLCANSIIPKSRTHKNMQQIIVIDDLCVGGFS